MWVLTKSTTEECFYLIPEKAKYTVGRVGADLALDDKSISRMHAHLHVTPEQTLALEDVGSKYGTFRNEGIASKTAIAKRERIELHAGDRIQFGVLENVWKVAPRRLVTMTSALPRDKAEQFEQDLSALGGRITARCDEDVSGSTSTTTYLTMHELSVTVKLLHALLQDIPIVNCDYWCDLLHAARSGSDPLPQASDYMPRRSAQLLQPQHFDVDLGARPERRRIFVGMTFVFMNRKHFEIYAPIVQQAGGVCKDLKCGVQKPLLLKPNVVVVQYVSATESQGSQTICSITDYLESNSRRLIPEYEIGLAIVHCSTFKYCNPDYKILGDLMPASAKPAVEATGEGTAFIENTNLPPKQHSEQKTDVLVPETEQSSASNGIEDIDDYEMPNMRVTESVTRDESQNKRSRDLVDDNEDDEQNNENLFHFTKKPHLDSLAKSTKKGNEQSVATAVVKEVPKIPPPAPDQYGFFGKSQVGPRRSECGQPGASTENAEAPDQQTNNTRKRQRIAVLSDGDDDDNELFGFGGASGAKSARMEVGNDSGEELFGFTKKAAPKDCENKAAAGDDDDDEDDLDPTQTFVPKGKSLIAIKVPIRKILPREVSTAGWLSCSLNRMQLKVEPKTYEDGDEPKLETEDVSKMEDDSSAAVVIKKEEGVGEDDETSLWVKSLKGAFHVRKSAVNAATRAKDASPSSHDESSDLSIGIAMAGNNFKTFVKKSNPHPQQKVITTVRSATFPLRLR